MSKPGRLLTFFLVIFVASLLPPSLPAQEPALRTSDGPQRFVFKYIPGDQYRIVSEVYQEQYIDGEIIQITNQLNRIQVRVGELRSGQGGRTQAEHFLTYQHSTESESFNQVRQFDRSYTSEFLRDDLGWFDIGTEYFVPTVQNVPVFPDRPLSPGDTWSAEGIEVHDLRDGLEVEQPFRFKMPVSYTYRGSLTHEGRVYDRIDIEYRVYYPTRLSNARPTTPRLVTGQSSQVLYWDREAGRPAEYAEEYEISLFLANGMVLTFQGYASAEVVDTQVLDRKRTVEALENEIRRQNIQDVQVRISDDGISLVLEDIQFGADSAVLLPAEIAKLAKIADILRAYPDNDILITGHTALAGSAAGRQQLSEERAATVGQFLLDRQVRDRSGIMFRGVGADEPVAPNTTEEGRRRNRRVEIKILDN